MYSQPVPQEGITDPKTGGASSSGDDKDLLREIREDFQYFRDFWRENHAEMRIDLRFISGDPWNPEDRKMREDNNRPVLSPDELSQYQNATINNLRQNKRAIKVSPRGSGATDKDAERRGALIRGIEYKSNAQGAYTNAFENQINCGMGFFRITTKVISKDGEVEPRIKSIENPLSVLLDPNAKEPDFCDQKRCFVFDVMRQRDFAKQWPKAQKTSFTAEDMAGAADWFQAENIMVAEYWRIDGYDENGDGGKVTQYITNGVEILDKTEWPGSWIPIVAVMGKKVFVPKGTEVKRYYYSQIRLARGAQMMLAYAASQEAEEVGMMPRVPVVGYVGQFETDSEAWSNLNIVPRAYIQVDPVVDASNGQILPLPQRSQFAPNIQAYEMFVERWRRSLQASMGISPLPTAAQRQNEKSGIALDKIQTAQAVGSFHFTDNFDRSLEFAGRQLDELITKVIDTARQMSAQNPDGTQNLIHVAPTGQQPQAQPGEQIDPDDVFDPQKGDFDVTISTGPSYQSQRDQASDFADTLLQSLPELPLPPQTKATLLSLTIKLKDIGPIGDEIAKIVDPQGDGEPIPAQAQQMMGQLQQEIQHLQQALAVAGAKVQDLEFEKKAGIVKGMNDVKLKQMDIEKDLAVAEINTKAQELSERITFVQDMVQQLHVQAHDSAMSAQEAQQDQQMQSQQADQAAQLQDQQGQQQSQLQQQAQEADSGSQDSNG